MNGELKPTGNTAGLAKKPYPGNGKPDVSIDVGELWWTPGEYVEAQGGTHNVFFGTNFNDVNESTVTEQLGTTVYNPQVADDNDFDPGALEFGTTYYWRVDEVNALDTGEYKGRVWSFTIEDEAVKLPFENIIATAIGSSSGLEPNDTVNESGLDPNSEDMLEHCKGTDYWSYNNVDNNNVWIQYDFDKKYKLHEMLVWNFNQNAYLNRYGFKDVLIQYSEDGETWVDMNDVNDVHVFNKASGLDGYKPNTTVSFNDAIVKSVRITAFSNWSEGSFTVFGLSEVRFTYIPVWAKLISPADDTTNIDFDTTLKWLKGREAVTHRVYFDTDEDAVTKGTSAYYDVSETSYPVTLRLGQTYYWRVDEINPDMTPSVWEGLEVWSMSTPSGFLIEGFETGYDDIEPNTVFLTWEDGGDPGTSSNGSWMGRHNPPYLHTIHHGGGNGHSSPMDFGRNGASDSFVTAQTVNLPVLKSSDRSPTDWSIGSPTTLTIWFRGDPNNSTTVLGDHELYCTIGGKTATYGGNLKAYLNMNNWKQFDIDLDSLGADLTNIPEITIGVRKVGTNSDTGVIYIDDIQLTGLTPLIAGTSVFIEAEEYDSITPRIIARTDGNDADIFPPTTNEMSGTGYIVADIDGDFDDADDEPNELGIISYVITIEESGSYIINGRIAVYRPSQGVFQDSFWVKIVGDNVVTNVNDDLYEGGWAQWNNIPRSTTGFGANQTQVWAWHQVHNTTDDGDEDVIWTLEPGTYTLEFGYRDVGTYLDVIEIVKVGG
jgi:hypothetical protein